jgi:hypothetical protein
MKTRIQNQLKAAVFLLLSILLVHPPRVAAQGSLTPPGAPAPGMKTLAQMEPRTAITNSGAVTINVPGSYYLTTNITVSGGDAITIVTNNVTLDLNGFTISSTVYPAAGSAILLSGSRTNIAIFNGYISSGVTNNLGTFSGSGFAYGINSPIQPAYSMRVKDLSVTGVLNNAILLGVGYATTVSSCTVSGPGSYGIAADNVLDSAAGNCGALAIYATTALNCSGICVGGSYGIYASTAQNCYGICGGSGVGLEATTAINCYGNNNGTGGGQGIYATIAQNCYGACSGNGTGLSALTAENCYAYSGGSGYAINTTSALNCYGYCSGSGYGIYATATVIGSIGTSNTGTGLLARLASSSQGIGSVPQNITYKYNMP